MISVKIEGFEAVRARLARMRENSANLSPALLRSGAAVLKAARERIDAGGPGWAPNISHTSILHGTGRLLSSLTPGGTDNVTEVSGNTIQIGTNLPVAPWLQDGTGIYGPRGEPIRPLVTEGFGRGSERVPRSALQKHIAGQTGIFGDPSVLAFPIGGKMSFFKSVKGSPPRPFLYIDERLAEIVRKIFADYVMGRSASDA